MSETTPPETDSGERSDAEWIGETLPPFRQRCNTFQDGVGRAPTVRIGEVEIDMPTREGGLKSWFSFRNTVTKLLGFLILLANLHRVYLYEIETSLDSCQNPLPAKSLHPAKRLYSFRNRNCFHFMSLMR